MARFTIRKRFTFEAAHVLPRHQERMVDEHLDHYVLNGSLDMESPTSEAVAQWVFRHLRARGLPLSAVTIEETCTSVCTYRE